MHSALKRLLPVLAFVAVGCMQVFGLQRGFVCECGSKPKVTLQDHCDSLHHGDGCHEGDEDVPHSKKDHTDDTPSREHSSYKEDVSANRASGSQLSVPQPLLYVITSLEWVMPEVTDSQVNQTDCMLPAVAEVGRQSWSRMLAHTIVLRV